MTPGPNAGSMTEGVRDPWLTAEGEVGLARLALDDGELQHAADHFAGPPDRAVRLGVRRDRSTSRGCAAVAGGR